MATVPKSDRITIITLASATAGPFDLTFRMFDDDALTVFVNDLVRDDFTISSNYVDGYDDNASITFSADLSQGDVIRVYGDLVPGRGSDYQNGPGLTEKMNIELGRIWASLSEVKRDTKHSLKTFSVVPPTEPIDGKALVWNEAEGRFIYASVGEADIAMSVSAAEKAQDLSENARDKSHEWAENPEDIEVEPGEFSSRHHAAKASAAATQTSEDRIATAADVISTEAARDTAYINADVYDDTTAGLASVDEGVQFQVVTGHEIIRYADLSGVAVEKARLLSASGVDALADRGLPRSPTLVPDYNLSNLCTNLSSFQWSAAQGASTYWNITLRPDEIAAGLVTIFVPVTTGVFSSATVDQRNGTAQIASTTQTLQATSGGLRALNIPLDGAATGLRVFLANSNATACVFTAPQVSVATPWRVRTDPTLLGMESLRNQAADAPLNIWGVASIDAISGTAPVASGDTVTIAAGSIAQINASVSGKVAKSDSLFLMFKSSAPLRSATIRPKTGGGGGDGVESTNTAYLGDGWYMIRAASAAAGGDVDPLLVTLRIANTNNGGFTSAEATLSSFYLAKNTTVPPTRVAPPSWVNKALTDAGVSVAFVDYVNGSDSNNGGKSAPLKTLSAALAVASRVFLRANAVHYAAPGLTVADLGALEISSYRETGDELREAVVRFSTPTAYGDLTATVADANVLYMATATNPVALFETLDATGEITRLGVDNPSRTGQTIAASSEADVRSNAGAWWFGTGSEGQGIYVHPTGSSATGKALEVPSIAANWGLTISNVGVYHQNNVAFEMGYYACLTLENTFGVGTNARFSYASFENGLFMDTDAFSTWIGFYCEYSFCHQDGMNVNGNIRVRSSISAYINNGGDGASPHFTNNDVEHYGDRFEKNAKQGFVSVGTGPFYLANCVARDNGDKDILIRTGTTSGDTSVKLIGNKSDNTEVSSELSAITVTIEDHTGPIELENVTAVVSDHKSVKQTTPALRAKGSAVVTLDDFKYANANYGIWATGTSTVAATNGHVLRCAVTGVLEQDTASITFDVSEPVNIYGNTTETSGLDAGELAKTVSFQAI